MGLVELFAADGYELVLVARREEKLREIAAVVAERHGVHVARLGLDSLIDTEKES